MGDNAFANGNLNRRFVRHVKKKSFNNKGEISRCGLQWVGVSAVGAACQGQNQPRPPRRIEIESGAGALAPDADQAAGIRQNER